MGRGSNFSQPGLCYVFLDSDLNCVMAPLWFILSAFLKITLVDTHYFKGPEPYIVEQVAWLLCNQHNGAGFDPQHPEHARRKEVKETRVILKHGRVWSKTKNMIQDRTFEAVELGTLISPQLYLVLLLKLTPNNLLLSSHEQKDRT